MRGILVDWLVEVAEEYKLVPDTLFLSVAYIDRCLSLMPVRIRLPHSKRLRQISSSSDPRPLARRASPGLCSSDPLACVPTGLGAPRPPGRPQVVRAKLQLVGVGCMLIAAKYEEIYAPQVEEFCYITDNTYDRPQVLSMERQVKPRPTWRLRSPPAVLPFKRGGTRREHGRTPPSRPASCAASPVPMAPGPSRLPRRRPVPPDRHIPAPCAQTDDWPPCPASDPRLPVVRAHHADDQVLPPPLPPRRRG